MQEPESQQERRPQGESPRSRSAYIRAGLAAFVVVAIAFLFRDCGRDGNKIDFPPLTVKLPDLSKSGSLSGSTVFEGTPPKPKLLEMGDAWCKASHKTAVYLDSLVITDGRLKDVLVYVKSGLEAYTFDYEKAEAVMDQVGCIYVPHVLAVRTFQPVVFKSSDATPHNVNTSRSRVGQGFNRTFNSTGERQTVQFRKPELNLPSVCNIHPWMQAAIHILEHPYFVVTGADGRYELKNLPVGSYTIAALHPDLGSQETKIEILGGESLTKDFTFKKK